MAWLKSEGDKVEMGEAVLVVESDKADMDVESYDEGYLAAIITGNVFFVFLFFFPVQCVWISLRVYRLFCSSFFFFFCVRCNRLTGVLCIIVLRTLVS